MRFDWRGFFLVLGLFGSLFAGIPALIQWDTFNGIDVLAILFFLMFLAAAFVNTGKNDEREK